MNEHLKRLLTVAFVVLAGASIISAPKAASAVSASARSGAAAWTEKASEALRSLRDRLNRLVNPERSPESGESGKESENGGAGANALSTAPPVTLYKPVLDYEEAVVRAVDRAAKSVVSIVVSKDLPVLEQCPYDPWSGMLNDPFFGGFQLYRPCDLGKRETKKIGGGSGFIVSSEGLILTNRHVVEDETASYTVVSSDGEKFAAQVVARDTVQDLALLKIEAKNLPVLALGDSSALKLGQTAIAIGNALGEFKNTVSVGVVSGLGRTVTAQGGRGSQTIEGVIQTDAAINPGNSGGPLLNLKGEVIGINTAVASGAQNIGFALPANRAKRVLASYGSTGRIVYPYLGVRYTLLDSGAKVVSETEERAVLKGSPAEAAGVREGDIITKVNGQKIGGEVSLATVLQQFSVGETVTLTLRRGDEELVLMATLTERPAGE